MLTVGEKSFDSIDAVQKYTSNLLETTTKGKELDPVASKVIQDVVKRYHPNGDDKIGPGVVSVYVKKNTEHPDTKCFWFERKDGIHVDFSLNKCYAKAREELGLGSSSSIRKINKPCRFGANCRNRYTTCGFQHPAPTGPNYSTYRIQKEVDSDEEDEEEKKTRKYISSQAGNEPSKSTTNSRALENN